MNIKDKLKIRLDLVNNRIELYKKHAIEEIEKGEMIPATNDVAMLRDLKEQQLLIKQILEGKNVAIVTDAGTPGISDPGEELVRQCHEAGIRVTALPGACALINALIVSGRPTRRFCFEAFLPHDKKERRILTPEQRKQKRQHERHRQQYRRYRFKKRLQLVAGAACIVVLLIAGISAGTSLLTAGGVSTDESVSQMESTPKPTITPQEPSPTPAPEESQASQAEPTPTPPESTAAPTEGYVYSQPVPKSDKVETSYFDDAVFIGDSRTEGFIYNTGLANAKAYTHKGLTVSSAFDDPVIPLNGQKVSVTQALLQTQFAKAYLMFGINEAGWAYGEIFIKKYGELIDAVRQANPQAQIYIQSILPVSKKTSQTHEFAKKEKLDEYNQMLRQLAEEKQVYYLDVQSCMVDEDGFLPEQAAFDGIHLKQEYCLKWLDYLCTHTVS